MTFLYPAFLWTLLFVSVPIIIHLFSFRVHKLVYFSKLKFLKDIKEASESKSKLKQLLILLTRILLIASLALAFAGPYIPLKKSRLKDTQKIVSIYLDNSFSMNAKSIYGNLFDAAKERARQIVSAYDNRQKFLYADNDLSGVQRNIVNKEQIIEFIDEAVLTPTVRQLSEIENYQKQFLQNEFKQAGFQNKLFVIGDFQKISSDFNHLQADSNSQAYLLPLSSNQINNLYIDSCWFDSPGRSMNKLEGLNVRVLNSGIENYENIPLKLFINGKQKAINSLGIEKNSEKTIKLNFTNTETGILSAKLEITDYPITYDNSFYFDYRINKITNILLINKKGENKYVDALFAGNEDFKLDFEQTGSIKTSVLGNYQLIVLDELQELSSGLQQELAAYMNKGGSVVFIPSAQADLNSYKQFLNLIKADVFTVKDSSKTEIGKINYQHYIYQKVFKKTVKKLNLPRVKMHYKTSRSSVNMSKDLLVAINGDALLTQTDYGKGKFFAFSFPLNTNNGNFMEHQLFVPTLYNIAAYSQSQNDIYHTIGQSELININLNLANNKVLRVVDEKSGFEFVPKIIGTGTGMVKLDMMDQLSKAGNYFIISDEDTLAGLSFNYDRKESDTGCYRADEIKSLLTKYQLNNYSVLSGNIETLNANLNELVLERKALWKLFIVLALVFIAAEIALIKFWKE